MGGIIILIALCIAGAFIAVLVKKAAAAKSATEAVAPESAAPVVGEPAATEDAYFFDLDEPAPVADATDADAGEGS